MNVTRGQTRPQNQACVKHHDRESRRRTSAEGLKRKSSCWIRGSAPETWRDDRVPQPDTEQMSVTAAQWKSINSDRKFIIWSRERKVVRTLWTNWIPVTEGGRMCTPSILTDATITCNSDLVTHMSRVHNHQLDPNWNWVQPASHQEAINMIWQHISRNNYWNPNEN